MNFTSFDLAPQLTEKQISVYCTLAVCARIEISPEAWSITGVCLSHLCTIHTITDKNSQ